MPIYEWECATCGHKETVIASIADRDAFVPEHDHEMRRLPGGTGLLYFEEGRARPDLALGGPPITSPADRARRMRAAGVSEGGVLPESIRKNPKSEAMKRYVEKDHKRWI